MVGINLQGRHDLGQMLRHRDPAAFEFMIATLAGPEPDPQVLHVEVLLRKADDFATLKACQRSRNGVSNLTRFAQRIQQHKARTACRAAGCFGVKAAIARVGIFTRASGA